MKWYDYYIRPFGKCHPDFNTTLIGDDARGVKICTRRTTTATNDDSQCSTLILKDKIFNPKENIKISNTVYDGTGLYSFKKKFYPTNVY